jgi:hypothetical protein
MAVGAVVVATSASGASCRDVRQIEGCISPQEQVEHY